MNEGRRDHEARIAQENNMYGISQSADYRLGLWLWVVSFVSAMAGMIATSPFIH